MERVDHFCRRGVVRRSIWVSLVVLLCASGPSPAQEALPAQEAWRAASAQEMLPALVPALPDNGPPLRAGYARLSDFTGEPRAPRPVYVETASPWPNGCRGLLLWLYSVRSRALPFTRHYVYEFEATGETPLTLELRPRPE